MAAPRVSRRSVLRGLGAIAGAAALGAPMPGPRRAHAARPGRLRFGVQTPPQHVTYDDILAAWQEADELGLDSAFVFDHSYDRAVLRTWAKEVAPAAREA